MPPFFFSLQEVDKKRIQVDRLFPVCHFRSPLCYDYLEQGLIFGTLKLNKAYEVYPDYCIR